MISEKENRLFTLPYTEKYTIQALRKHNPLFFQDTTTLKSKLIERIKQASRETSSDWKGPISKLSNSQKKLEL